MKREVFKIFLLLVVEVVVQMFRSVNRCYFVILHATAYFSRHATYHLDDLVSLQALKFNGSHKTHAFDKYHKTSHDVTKMLHSCIKPFIVIERDMGFIYRSSRGIKECLSCLLNINGIVGIDGYKGWPK
jgi:hypothetical protein